MFGTPEWDSAAAAYASTPTGRMELASSLAAAEAAEDVRSAVAFEHALAEGRRLREKAALFRDELAAHNAASPLEPVPVDVIPVEETGPSDADDDEWETSEEGVGGYAFTDEERWENDLQLHWSPTMRGQSWDTSDPVFTGCEPSMSMDGFVDRVCDNVGVSRAEFEAAAADYFAEHAVAFATRGSDKGLRVGAFQRISGHDGESLRHLAVSASPHYTPEQIRAIALLAKQRQNEREQTVVNNTDTDSATSIYRSRRGIDLPDDPERLTALADSDAADIRAAVAGHPSTPADVVDRLATSDQKVEVRAAAARNENLPADTLVTLATDRSIKVRAGAARNPAMPVEHLTTLAADSNDTVRGAVARNPSTPPALYADLAANDSMTVRKHAARRAYIPAPIVARLATDSEQQVRAAVAKNRTTTADALQLLARDEAQSVRAAAARNRNMAPALLRGRLSRDPAPGVRAAVARNENTSVAVLTRLSTDADPWVRRNVAWNPASPAVLLFALSQDPDDGVRSSARNREETGGGAA